ncbi:MAG: pilus assembly protein PilP [Myxococcota bacterium]
MRPANWHDVTRTLALVCFALAGACEEAGSDAPVPAPKAVLKASAPSAAVAPGTAAEAERPFAYSPIGKRDPFRSYLADLQETEQSTASRKLEETEQYELDQYRLTGLITGTSQPRAMVEDPVGRGHVLHIGSHLGKNGGRVTRIAPDAIEVTEEFRAPTGERVRVPIKIKLPAPDMQLEVEP